MPKLSKSLSTTSTPPAWMGLLVFAIIGPRGAKLALHHCLFRVCITPTVTITGRSQTEGNEWKLANPSITHCDSNEVGGSSIQDILVYVRNQPH